MEKKISIDLDNPEFQQAYRLLKQTNANVFLTGRAGTGKSTFLRYICENLKKKHVVLAPTGVAAVNVGGVTIHSFFQMPLRPVPPDDLDYSIFSFKNPKRFPRQKRKLIKELELIIIDEVSMVRPDMIDFIDRVLRGVTGRRGKPFGGVQLLLVGDIFQLEPVVNADSRLILSKYYKDFFFFNAWAYRDANLVSIELKKIYRQTDPRFIGVLDRVRMSKVTREDIALLNSYSGDNVEESEFGITLTTRREIASSINKEKMESLPGEEFVFKGEIKDDFPEKLLPTDLNLVLKKDAQVMLIRNDKDRRWVNGTLARITDISDVSITIKLENGKEEKLEREIWDNITYTYDEETKKIKEEILGQFVQYPLRAAWALTIHKSQGLTFSHVSIDMGGGAFTAGQTYVALSRCRSLEGIRMLNPISSRDVIVSRGARTFSNGFNDKDVAERVLQQAEAEKLSRIAQKKFDEGKFDETVESMWMIHKLTGVLEKKSVRRIITGKLKEIEKLREENRVLKEILSELSDEFTQLGEISLIEGQDMESAFVNFEKAISLNSSNHRATIGKAECLMRKGERKEALKLLDSIKGADKETGFIVLMLKGSIYEKEENHANALLSYTAAMKKDKNAILPLQKVIELYEQVGMEREADKYKKRLEERLG